MQDHFLVKYELIFQILSPQPYILHMGCKLLIQMVEQEITAAAMPLQILFPQLLFHDLYILPELPCRDQGSPLPQSDHLLHTIRGHNRNMVFPPDLMDHLLNVLVCRLRLFRIDHMDIVVFHDLQVFSFHHLKVDFMGNEKWVIVPADFGRLKELLFSWQEGMAAHNAWNAVFWCNHDQPRVVSRFGDEGDTGRNPPRCWRA